MGIQTDVNTTQSRKRLGQVEGSRDVPLVVFYADIFETPCPTSGGYEPAKRDVRIQFYEAIKAKYPPIANQIRGAWRDTIIFTPTKDRVVSGHGWWKPRGQYDKSHADHSIYCLKDFIYQPGAWLNSSQKDERYQAYFKWLKGKQ
ncbi:hypothetical protein [Kordiimonas sp. SCSIO 12610]|uniref:hypothetical protein n=1 Tax=Kordiimonas sp. SCSIO 12610 TaxID=2829597 RepID=UPI002108D2BA|nr:hypothetical protein [Kordiimonas sp. SCSIO 12610]UTW54400.1 hypothetical protein KFF44_11300 [Kordiimonas sp. SCSIO 12610]